MHNLSVITDLVERVFSLGKSLINPRPGTPKLALEYGDPGLGKTIANLMFADMVAREVGHDRRPLFIRALATDTLGSFLKNLVTELGQEPRYFASDLYHQAESMLSEYPRLLIIDEIDRLIPNRRAVEMLRDLSDVAGCGIMMIGMNSCERQLARLPHVYYRMKGNILHVKPLSVEGVKNVIDKLSEVALDDSAIRKIHEVSGGKIGDIIPEIIRAEKISRANDLKTVSDHHLMRKVA